MPTDNQLIDRVKQISILDYDYPLPQQRIAQQPVLPRENAKLLLSSHDTLSDHYFYDLPQLLPSNSLLVFNSTKVIPARLAFTRPTGGRIEVFLLAPSGGRTFAEALCDTHSSTWSCLVGNAKKWHDDSLTLPLPDGAHLVASRLERDANNAFTVHFEWNTPQTLADILALAGAMPIPPYLNRKATPDDNQWYQTIYASTPGSVAAPTAGLHFSEQLIAQIQAKQHRIAYTTLHVGAGTFLPVKSDTIGGHAMHSEPIALSRSLIETLANHHGPVIPVGTTSLRLLESAYWLGVLLCDNPNLQLPTTIPQWLPYYDRLYPEPRQALEAIRQRMEADNVDSLSLSTALIIVPGYTMRIATGIITNFHQPKSTLLLLVAAFLGDRWRQLYQHALDSDYRFLSYGDGMLILP